MFRPVISRTAARRGSSLIVRSHQRTLISVPEVPHIDAQKDSGIEGLYSAKGLKAAWYDGAESALASLEEVIDASVNRATLKNAIDTAQSKGPEAQLESLVKSSVKTPDSYDAFNIASKVYNNFLAISSLKPNSDSQIFKPTASSLLESPSIETDFLNEPKDYLHSWIIESFGSIVEFRTLLLNSNLAIKGNGFTWLVARGIPKQDSRVSMTKYDKLYVVNTYNSGTPNLEEFSGQIQSLKEQLKQEERKEREDLGILEPEVIARLPTVEEAQFQTSLLDNSFYLPVLLINGSPSAYLPDYGVFGKKLYLNNIWDSIDWQAVSARLPNSNERPRF